MPERVMTPESEKYAKIGKQLHLVYVWIITPLALISIEMSVVNQVAKYGFPQSTIINSLRKNLANHCTTSYYLLLMDQVF